MNLLKKWAGALRARLIDDVRAAWRLWSLRLGALALALQSVLVASPGFAREAWDALPVDLKAHLPSNIVNLVGVVLIAGTLFARVLKQKAPADGR